MTEKWTKFSKSHPCPICGKPDWCDHSPDGKFICCMREGKGAIKALPNKGWLHHGEGGGNGQVRIPAGKDKAWKSAEDIRDYFLRKNPSWTFNCWWPYHSKAGNEVLRVLRFNLPPGSGPDKQYRPIYPVAGGWSIGDPPGPLPLYNLPRLAEATTIYVFEGEKAAEAARTIGLTVTTSAHGSKSAGKSDWTPLAGKDVVICPDHDEPGEGYLDHVAGILAALDPPAKVRALRLPGLAESDDMYDFIEQRDSMEPEAIRAEVEKLASEAPVLTAPAVEASGPVLKCLADVEPRAVSWLWPGRFPLGRISLLVGRPGEGKSFLTTDMSARVSTGTPWPDGSLCPKGSVILVSAEDDPADTIRPRLDAHHADCRRVHLLSAVRRIDDKGKPHEVLFTLSDMEALEAALKIHPDCRLVIVDPIGSFLGGDTDAHRDNEVRGILAPVGMLAEKYGPAVLVVAHRRKSAGTSADDLALGSRAFTGIARAVWHVSRDKDDKNRRLFLPGKNNLAPEGDGLAFAIQGYPASVVWERDPVTMNADDGLAEENGEGKSECMTPAAEWLLEELKDYQEHAVNTVRKDADAAGFAWRTVQSASLRLGVQRKRLGFGGGFTWRLPKQGTPIRAGGCAYDNDCANGANGTNGEKR